ncbi:hypothetical protein RKE30_15300 [Streptomyces sp. Li-HN-5-11]|uniref:hypothetical protein n=1 Tax=Streptomyces sp. Li-HN-5-11 TaxID=3075432 RepID=UPI0028B1252F|nr:hypothetical protein [Streptomyces sp. Li-HN-5-11]WNM31675.1 hypothetical protein RKE30_15300 [Streptomyces sp. Li-HN-5-11]
MAAATVRTGYLPHGTDPHAYPQLAAGFPAGPELEARCIVPLLAAGALLVPGAAASAAPSGSTGRAVAKTAVFSTSIAQLKVRQQHARSF